MKVLARGLPPEERGWRLDITCTGSGNGGYGCRARLQVNEFDVYRTKSCHYDGSTEHYQTIRCPECGKETDIPRRSWAPTARGSKPS